MWLWKKKQSQLNLLSAEVKALRDAVEHGFRKQADHIKAVGDVGEEDLKREVGSLHPRLDAVFARMTDAEGLMRGNSSAEMNALDAQHKRLTHVESQLTALAENAKESITNMHGNLSARLVDIEESVCKLKMALKNGKAKTKARRKP